MRVVVGSRNPLKVEGVKQAFELYFDDVTVESRSVDSGVESQPFNNRTIEGAINRALNSYSEEFDFAVGVEAGLFSFKNTITGFIDFQVSAVYDGSRVSIGFGPGFEYPPFVVEEVLKGREVGDVMDELTGIKNLGEKTGAIYFLTKGKISRVDLTRISVINALIPWINREYYFKSFKSEL
ncbi:inosine/xanthosine triphosphatase [Archaeoglobus sulfaticallidus PM70-1]|uniref:Probable inosine/xanthosine triphosphatase n=1 Tax=Archaeoglobus sulfaticallidus PM70-1 TaxID=387631 RepID=N0B934_9EURY|nr:inosine/xanthosine triphosphatase [Archaeoglobus sulfaticallidus]AGK60134.1 inosine/xanthosine triphosphatase [Archaeoglobus sulfaticallidus PM70-1]